MTEDLHLSGLQAARDVIEQKMAVARARVHGLEDAERQILALINAHTEVVARIAKEGIEERGGAE